MNKLGWRNRLVKSVHRFDVLRHPMRFRIRLLGTAIVDYAGEDNTGKLIRERWPDYNDAPLRQVVERRLSSWWRGPSELRPEKHDVELERVRLPLARDGETVDMLVCLTVFLGSDGREIFNRI